jgi:hypothetical protein
MEPIPTAQPANAPSINVIAPLDHPGKAAGNPFDLV